MMEKHFFDNKEKAIQFILLTPELTNVYMNIRYGGCYHIVDGMEKDFIYREKLLEIALSIKEFIPAVTSYSLSEMGKLFQDRQDLQEKILNAVFQDGAAAKKCFSNEYDITEINKAFPQHTDKLKMVTQNNNSQDGKPYRP